MPVTLLDLIVIGVMLISALLAMVRGFTREVLSIAAWVAAAAAALFLHPFVTALRQSPYIKNPTVAQLVAGGGVFLVTLIVVSFITIRISDLILDSRIGAIDRTLGFVFGGGARPFAGHRRVPVLRLAGAGRSPAGLGATGQIEADAAIRRQLADEPAAERSGKRDPEAAAGAGPDAGRRAGHRSGRRADDPPPRRTLRPWRPVRRRRPSRAGSLNAQ